MLGYCIEGYKLRQKNENAKIWQSILEYVIPAIKIGVREGAWGKDKLKYPEKPYEVNENNEFDNEKEIQMKREAFVLKMRAMKANWDMTHQKKDSK